MVFLYSHWLKLSIATRHKIAAEFGIQKKGATEVANNEVVKDGYILGDIETALNIDAIQKYLGTEETNYAILWEYLVAKIEGRTPTAQAAPVIAETVVETSPAVKPVEEVMKELKEVTPPSKRILPGAPMPPKKRGRPFKKKI